MPRFVLRFIICCSPWSCDSGSTALQTSRWHNDFSFDSSGKSSEEVNHFRTSGAFGHFVLVPQGCPQITGKLTDMFRFAKAALNLSGKCL